ncbi:hypothetical protein [Paraburkholderia heleia]|nr:hypothetical protein [Paraburkholderia heleia]
MPLRKVFLDLDPDVAYVLALPRLGYALVADMHPEPVAGCSGEDRN